MSTSNVSVIKQFLIDEFLPDVSAAELDVDHDMLSDGVIDSLGVLKLIAWIEERFGLTVSDTELDPDNFRTVTSIDTFIANNTGSVTGSVAAGS